MKSLVKTENYRELVVREFEMPKIKDDEVLVKVSYCGVCGSDLHAASHASGYEFVPKPIILGHEFSGEVVAVSKPGQQDLVGKKVAVLPSLVCGSCPNCVSGNTNICSNIRGVGLHLDGGMTEYFVTTSEKLLILPNELPLDIGALTEPLSVAIHAVRRVDGNLKNKRVLIQGCGIIGIFTAYFANMMGAQVLISGLKEDLEVRLSKAEELGLDTKLSHELEESPQEFDIMFECSGSVHALDIGFKKLRKGGTLVLVALYEKPYVMPLNQLVRSEISVLTSYAANKEDFQEAINVLTENIESIQGIITPYNLEDGQRAFDDAYNKAVLKPILKI